jgi:hypothetical protein
MKNTRWRRSAYVGVIGADVCEAPNRHPEARLRTEGRSDPDPLKVIFSYTSAYVFIYPCAILCPGVPGSPGLRHEQ